MSFPKVRVQIQRFLRRTDHFWACFIGTTADKNRAEVAICFCQADVSRCKRWILANGGLKVANPLFDVSLAVTLAELAFEITLINFRRDGAHCAQPFMFFACDRDLDLTGNGLGHIALKGEHVL